MGLPVSCGEVPFKQIPLQRPLDRPNRSMRPPTKALRAEEKPNEAGDAGSSADAIPTDLKAYPPYPDPTGSGFDGDLPEGLFTPPSCPNANPYSCFDSLEAVLLSGGRWLFLVSITRIPHPQKVRFGPSVMGNGTFQVSWGPQILPVAPQAVARFLAAARLAALLQDLARQI